MKLSIKLKNPSKTICIFYLTWSLIFFIFAGLLFFFPMSLPIYIQLLLLLLVPIMALINLKQIKNNSNQAQAIYWDGRDWYLLIDEDKRLIKLIGSSRVMKHWVLLNFQFSEDKKLLAKQLFLPKDAMSDVDFRNLCRTLRFLPSKENLDEEID